MHMFESLVPREKLHKSFSYILASRAHPAARRLLQKTFELLPKPDGNFVLDLQTSGFDARIWELYLAAFFRSVGLSSLNLTTALISCCRARKVRYGSKLLLRTRHKEYRRAPPKTIGRSKRQSRSNSAVLCTLNSGSDIGNCRTFKENRSSSPFRTSMMTTQSEAHQMGSNAISMLCMSS